MPLPEGSQIPLHSHSLPGETTSTKPKQAMIVKMTEEALDALQNLGLEERMEFEFSDNPGIWIRDVFFPMRSQPENTLAELFIRTTTASKPTGPLKLMANVVGRFVVEKELSEKVTKRIHDKTVAAQKQKAERKTQILDPSSIPSNGKGSKSRGSANHSRPSLNSKATAAALPSRNPAPSSLTDASPSEDSPLRKLLIHRLALGSQTLKQLLETASNLVQNGTARGDVLKLLYEVADQDVSSKKSQSGSSEAQTYSLKFPLWLQVRPYEWTDYTDKERLHVCRLGRQRLTSLNIPQDNPAWDHVNYRKDGPPRTSIGTGTAHQSDRQDSTTTSKALGKNGFVSTRTVKTKGSGRLLDSKHKLDTSTAKTLQASASREPSLKISTGPSGLSTEKEEGEISATPLSHYVKKLPGSRGTAIANVNAITPSGSHSNSPAPLSAQQPGKKGSGPVDARGSRVERPGPSGTARPVPPIAPPSKDEKRTSNSSNVAVKKDKPPVPSGSKSEFKEVDKTKNTSKMQFNVKQATEDDIAVASRSKAVVGMKRGRGAQEQDFEEGEPVRKKGQGLPPKPSYKTETPPPRNNTNRVASPLPPHKSSQVAAKAPNTSRLTSDVSKPERRTKLANDTTLKPTRRRSPIYTSSSDEELNRKAEVAERVVQRKPPKPPAPRLSTGDPRNNASMSTDRTSLRSRYSTVYVDYIAVFQKVVSQKNKIERRLKGGSGSSTSDEDVDMMGAEELEKLSAEYKRLQDELQNIKAAWGR